MGVSKSMTRSAVCASIVCFLPSRSTQKERDTESGNDYFFARYYTSALGRFSTPDWSAKTDPVPYATFDDPQSLNLYAYVRNNPLVRADADGHCAEDLCIGEAIAVVALWHATVATVAWLRSPSGQAAVDRAVQTTNQAIDKISNVLRSSTNGASKPPPAETPAPATSQSTPASPTPPDGGNNGNKKTEHGQQRADEARSGDSHREVGDANRVKAEGRTYTDSDNGNTVHVKGNRAVITDSEGNQVTQFKNTRANTAQRVKDGKWIPNS